MGAVAYGAGLRVAEVSMLKVGDVDSERMLLRVERGKGGRYRNAMLSPDLLGLLRQWWKIGHRQGVVHRDGWLFPGQHSLKPISIRQLHRIVVEAAQAAGITKRVGPHTLRHSFATHLLEDGVDIRIIQALLGHAKLDNTALYTKVATRTARAVTSPLDKLGLFTPEEVMPDEDFRTPHGARNSSRKRHGGFRAQNKQSGGHFRHVFWPVPPLFGSNMRNRLDASKNLAISGLI